MAITNAQQAKQIMNEGEPMEDIGFSIVKPSKNGKRPGYRSAAYQSARSSANKSSNKSSSKSTSSGNQNTGNQNTGNAREDYITNYVSKSKVKGGGLKKIVDRGDGPVYDYSDVSLTPTQIDNARKFKEEQEKERKEAIKKSRTFNPFPIATSVFDKINNSKLAKFNNRFQRNNYLRTLNADQQVALLEALAEEEGIGTLNPMGIDRNIQRGTGTYNYLDPEQVNKGFLGTGIGAGKFVTDIKFGGKDAKNTINEAMTKYNEDLASGLLDNDASVVLGDDQPGLTYDEYLDRNKTTTGGSGGEQTDT